LNARQRRLFEDAHKKNPHLKVPELQPVSNWTEADLALIKQGVGDKSTRPASAQAISAGSDASTGEEVGSIVTYFGEMGFGFLRPEAGGRDVFFHISRLSEGQATDLVPGTKVAYALGMDRTGKMAAATVRILPAESAPKEPAKS